MESKLIVHLFYYNTYSIKFPPNIAKSFVRALTIFKIFSGVIPRIVWGNGVGLIASYSLSWMTGAVCYTDLSHCYTISSACSSLRDWLLHSHSCKFDRFVSESKSTGMETYLTNLVNFPPNNAKSLVRVLTIFKIFPEVIPTDPRSWGMGRVGRWSVGREG